MIIFQSKGHIPTKFVDCGEDVKLEIKQESESNNDNTISVESKLEAKSDSNKKK